MQREELSKLIDNLVEQALYELRAEKGNVAKDSKALVIVPQTVFSLHKYEEYFLDNYKDIKITFACFFDCAVYKGKSEDIDYVYLNDEGQIEVSNAVDEFEKSFVIINDLDAIDKILSGECTDFVRELIGYYSMQEKSISLVTSYKRSLKLNTAVKSRLGKLKNNYIDIININTDEKVSDYDVDAVTEKKVITEKEVYDAHNAGVDVIRLSKKQLVTPLAKDRARNYGIKIAY